MAEGAISFALEQLRDLLYEEGRLLSGVGDGVKELEKQLVEMKCLIEDADKQRNKNKTVKNLIAEIRDLADRAEDAIELYAVRVSSKRRRGVKKVLRRYACILKECQSLHQLDSEISEIKSDLERVNKQMQEYGIIKKIVDGGESSDDKARKSYPDFEKGDCFVGMEKELKQLVCLIEGEEHGVISVWGMGGLGKTTIARKVYNQIKNHPNPASYFDCFAWVCISQQCQIRSVLEDVLKQLDPQRRENASSLSSLQQMVEVDLSKLSENELIELLIKIQRAHRCLIVIDDLWKISHWNDFKHAFVVEDLQNKVLVTTRKQNVAETIGFSVKHGNLNMDEAWELLKKKAFPHNNIPGTLQENESIGVLDLYMMWIAQGMISSETHGGKKGSLMDIAKIYFSELASRCIVEVELDDLVPLEKCKLHDVVREQCLLKGRKEGFGVTFLKLPGGDRGTVGEQKAENK